MLDDPTRDRLRKRLRRVEGQVAGLRRMIEDDTYCVDVLLQISAAQGALDKVGQILLESHMKHCVREAFEGGDDAAREQKIAELMDVFSRYGGARKGGR